MRNKISEETRKKMSDSDIAKNRAKPPNWKGGISRGENKAAYYVFKAKQRYRRKIGSGGSHSKNDWETLTAQYNWTCPSCKKKEPEIKLTEDHIIPLSKGGSDNIENIQPLCRSCNTRKHVKIIKYENDF